MTVLPILFAFSIGLSGALIFLTLGVPLPWLLGPITACLSAALVGIPMKGVTVVNEGMRTILGVAVGATFTPALLFSMGGMWQTLLLIPIMVLCIGFIGVPYFQKVCGYDWATSYYCAMPGGLQDILVFGEEAGGNIRTLSLIHATRVLVIVVTLPFILQGYWGAELNTPPGVPASSLPIDQIILMLVCAIIGWRVAKHFNMLGASILGPLILTASISLAGFLHQRPPAEAVWLAQFFIGMTVGVKYAGITVQEIRKDVTAGLGFCLILILFTLIFSEFIYILNLAPPMETILSFAPGGQAELTVLALIVGADMAFVVAHHVLRMSIVILGAPIFDKIFNKEGQR